MRLKNYKTDKIVLKKIGLFIEFFDLETNQADIIEYNKDPKFITLYSPKQVNWDISYSAAFSMYGITRNGIYYSGRHGHQGYLNNNFGLLKGYNIFVFPDAVAIKNIKIKFHIKKKWDIITTWDNNKMFFKEMASKGMLEEQLSEVLIGLGKFYKYKIKIKNSLLTLFLEKSSRVKEEADYIFDKISKIFSYQINMTRTKAMPFYNVVLTPWIDEKNTPTYIIHDWNKIYGANNSFGQGFSLRPDNIRDFELFSHRLQHAITFNKPSGMQNRTKEDLWYYEGLASYFELYSIKESGIISNLSRFKDFYFNSYMYMHFSDPVYRVPVTKDYLMKDNLLQFLHYVKAPLVCLLIDNYMKQQTENEHNIIDLLRHQISEFSSGISSFSIKRDIENFIEPEPFYSRYISGTEFMLFNEIFKDNIYSNDFKDNILAAVNGKDITEKDIRSYDVTLRCMINNDIGVQTLKKEFPSIYNEVKQNLFFSFYNRFGTRTNEYYKEKGFVKLVVLLKLLDMEAAKRNIRVQYDELFPEYQAVKGLKRLRLRYLISNLKFGSDDIKKLRSKKNENLWADYISTLLKTATIIYY